MKKTRASTVVPALTRPMADDAAPPVLPRSLPGWIHTEYQFHHQLWKYDELEMVLLATPLNAALKQMWARLEPNSDTRIIESDALTKSKSRLLPLARLLRRALRPHDRLTVAQRCAIAKNIRKWTSSLASELQELDAMPKPGPWFFAMESARGKLKSSLERPRLESALLDVQSKEEGQRRSDIVRGWGRGVGDLFYQASAFLEAINAAALEWSQSTPILPRPNTKFARRLFFSKIMEGFFFDHYGQRMKECNDTLTDVFFPSDETFLETHNPGKAHGKTNRKRKAT